MIFLLLNSLLLLIMCCINPINPEITEQTNMLVVDGSIIKGQEIQTIRISRSTTTNQPEYLPVEHCQVKVEADSGNEFVFQETKAGEYTAMIADTLLTFNSYYKLVFSTPEGNTYKSANQTLLATPPVDSLYCVVGKHYLASVNSEIKGLQYYVDIKAPDDAPRFYRWQIEETWEKHAAYQFNGFFDGQKIYFSLYPEDSLQICWDTEDINGFFVSSTTDQLRNEKLRIPLFFIDSTSEKLRVKYCVTIKQFALNEDAFIYWQQKMQESNENGSIYARQPSVTISNIYNIDNSSEQVPGFFWVSSIHIKHFCVVRPFEQPGPKCSAISFGFHISDSAHISVYTHSNVLPPEPPFYFWKDALGYHTTYRKECMDCRQGGGTTRKPDFWK